VGFRPRTTSALFSGSVGGAPAQDSKQNVYTVARNWEVDPKAIRLYNQHYGALDVWGRKTASIAAPQWVGTSQSLCSFQELSRTEFYNDFLEHFGLPYAMFSICQPAGHPDFVLGVYRGLHHGEFHSSELDLLHFLTPHIRRAFNLHLLISDLKDRSARMSTAFDMLPTAIILLGAQGEILLMNRAASAIVTHQDGLLAVWNRLQAQRPCESAQLEHVIGRTVGASGGNGDSHGNGLHPGGGLQISRRGRQALQLLITPGRNLTIETASPVCALVFIHDPEQRIRPGQNVLQRMFDLTPAENRVALLIGDGKSTREIAQLLNVSPNTLKSQLASIYTKTNTARQSQLVRLITRLSMEPSV